MRPGDKLYLTGPISGQPDRGEEAFRRVREKLRKAGYVVLCPVESTGIQPDKPRSYHMRRDCEMVLVAHGLVCLPGWMQSRGALLESLLAREIGTPSYEYREDLAPEDYPRIEMSLDDLYSCFTGLVGSTIESA